MKVFPIPTYMHANEFNIALKEDELVERLDLKKFQAGFWHLEQTCAISGSGLSEGFLWLVKCIRDPPQKLAVV